MTTLEFVKEDLYRIIPEDDPRYAAIGAEFERRWASSGRKWEEQQEGLKSLLANITEEENLKTQGPQRAMEILRDTLPNATVYVVLGSEHFYNRLYVCYAGYELRTHTDLLDDPAELRRIGRWLHEIVHTDGLPSPASQWLADYDSGETHDLVWDPYGEMIGHIPPKVAVDDVLKALPGTWCPGIGSLVSSARLWGRPREVLLAFAKYHRGGVALAD